LDAVQILKRSGCNAAKVKVAEGDDEARLEAIRDALGPGGRITIDANGAWDVHQAMEAIRVFRRYGIDLVEQPVATVEEMKYLRKRIDIPIAADESAATPGQAERVARLEAADVLVLKVQHMGGVADALKAVESTGLPAIVSSLIETSVGLSAGLALAAALPELDYPCGLATASLLESDVVANPLLPVDGRIQVRRPDVDLVGAARLLLDCDQDL